MDPESETSLISPDEKLIDLYQSMNNMLSSVNHDMQQIEQNIKKLVSHSSHLEPYFTPLLNCLASMNEKNGISK